MKTEEILGMDKITDVIMNSSPAEIAAMWNSMIEEAGSYCITEDEVKSFKEGRGDTLHALAAVMAAFAYEQDFDLGSAEIAGARSLEKEEPYATQTAGTESILPAWAEHKAKGFVHLRAAEF